MSTTMSGLRVYVNSPSTVPASPVGIEEADDGTVNRIFYSRRGNGPIYRWLYEEKLANWRALRMHTSDFENHKLANASWKSVPETLQVQLGAHYLD
ncbi:MAG: hypothetical protein ABJC10_07680 [Acidobacteriota bacterium]